MDLGPLLPTWAMVTIFTGISVRTNTSVRLGAGNDRFAGLQATVDAGVGNDIINFYPTSSIFDGGAGADTLIHSVDKFGSFVADVSAPGVVYSYGSSVARNFELFVFFFSSLVLSASVTLGNGNDVVDGTSTSSTRAFGGGGNDYLLGRGSSSLDGGSGNDTITVGHWYDSTIIGGSGDDYVSGGGVVDGGSAMTRSNSLIGTLRVTAEAMGMTCSSDGGIQFLLHLRFDRRVRSSSTETVAMTLRGWILLGRRRRRPGISVGSVRE